MEIFQFQKEKSLDCQKMAKIKAFYIKNGTGEGI